MDFQTVCYVSPNFRLLGFSWAVFGEIWEIRLVFPYTNKRSLSYFKVRKLTEKCRAHPRIIAAVC